MENETGWITHKGITYGLINGRWADPQFRAAGFFLNRKLNKLARQTELAAIGDAILNMVARTLDQTNTTLADANHERAMMERRLLEVEREKDALVAFVKRVYSGLADTDQAAAKTLLSRPSLYASAVSPP